MQEEAGAKIVGIAKKLLADSAREDELISELALINKSKRRLLADLEIILRDKSLNRFSDIEDIRDKLAAFRVGE